VSSVKGKYSGVGWRREGLEASGDFIGEKGEKHIRKGAEGLQRVKGKRHLTKNMPYDTPHPRTVASGKGCEERQQKLFPQKTDTNSEVLDARIKT